ncbi:MAG: winged helix-turn-helix transcriptional regulator [Methanobrevibacter arboriphilus]|uniref:Winged helix-turn-helix transcriptional regulator n=1 Tax=Methanobrevibacter arboriphilus TaxID=39441 RepID=A0A843AAG8_METAZ|nr:MarR family winged helix-turn-helix transcriptional regulator [Methanobrevibacter arboriphilus]MBF4468347.1 winged helix-turn-helix transcriptional regulator [Methanobrevibacter arboriphilus]
MFFNEKIDENEFKDLSLANFMTIANKAYVLYLNQRIEDLNINMDQIPLIVELDREKNVSKRDLAKYLFMNDRSMARSFIELYKLGIIDKKYVLDKEEEKRHIEISLTSYGKYIASEIRKIDEEWEKLIYNNLESSDKEEIMSNLKDLVVSSIKINNDNNINKNSNSKVLETKDMVDSILDRIFNSDFDGDYSTFRSDCFNRFKNYHNRKMNNDFNNDFCFRGNLHGKMHQNRRNQF